MKRLLALLAGGLGLGALLRRRSRAASPAPSPADDLRAKLDATKIPAEEQPAAQVSPDPRPETPDVDTRRADVHARARQAIDDLGETAKTDES
jgi:hypothetical protein